MGTESPEVWARGKASKLREYAGTAERPGAVLVAVRAALPVLSPGVPACAWLGVMANGGVRENTRGWLTGSAEERAEAARTGRTPIRLGYTFNPNDRTQWANRGFDELGVLGVEGGSGAGVVPAAGSSWALGARAPDVVAVLGRAGLTAPGSWVSVPDQVTVGMWNNRRHGLGCNERLPEALRFAVVEGRPARWSPWVFQVCTMAWSSGDAGAANHLSGATCRTRAERDALVAELARASEADRGSVWTRALTAGRAGPVGAAGSHSNPWYAGLRWWQKATAGEAAAALTGEGAEGARFCGFVGDDRAEVFRRLVAGAQGHDPGPRSRSPGAGSGSSVGEALSASAGSWVGKALKVGGAVVLTGAVIAVGAVLVKGNGDAVSPYSEV